MDTIYLHLFEEKRLLSWLASVTALGLLLSFVLSARATEIAYTIPPAVNSLHNSISEIEKSVPEDKKSLKFDEYIKNKYPGGIITDLEKGVKRIKVTRYFNSRPVKLNIVEVNFDLNPNLKITPAIAGKTLNNKTSIRNFNQREKAILSVNGGYFKPQTGVPLGLLMIDGRVYTGQIYDRVAMGIFDDKFDMARAKVDIKLTSNKGTLSVDNINQPRTLSSHTLIYDNLWGTKSPAAPKYGILLSIKDGKIIETSTTSLTIPENGFVISAPISKVSHILEGKNFKLSIKTLPEWKDVKHIISGGPYLIKDGEIFIDVTAQKLTSITGRNPRTAIGYTKDNNIIIITADGREKASVGLTLSELARYMQQIGCINAMNLDGGSSTVMFGAGQILNSPVNTGGIAVSNAVNVVME